MTWRRAWRTALALVAAGVAFAAAPLTGLVQSIPAGLDLAQGDLPFARDVWVDMVRSARVSLDLAQFYVFNAPGSAMEPVLRELEAAGRRGVRIRMLLSRTFLGQDPASVARLKAIPGCEVAVFDLRGVSRGILHAKYFLVDGTWAYLGSQNMDWRSLEQIHELGVQTRDPALVAPLARLFDVDWGFAHTGKLPVFQPEAPPAGRPGAELVASPPFLTPPGVRGASGALAELLSRARRQVHVQLLTYGTASGKGEWRVVDDALRAAAARGVRVDLLISDWELGGKGMEPLRALARLPHVRVRIAAIPEASTGHIPFARVIHSKYMTVDGDVLWVGTSNWEPSYFLDSRNVEAILRDPALAAQADALFRRLWESPFAFDLDPGKTYPRRVRE
jgi:phosphatidylserine/phosphatidylglycerophosphate/cardiolipin synthase-like enzyme